MAIRNRFLGGCGGSARECFRFDNKRKRMKEVSAFLIVATLVFTGCDRAPSDQAGDDNRPSILKKLDGEWIAKGHVMGDSVRYLITGKPILNNMFTEVHMIDMNRPPEYEALVFIGYDSTSENVFAHWLDVFGGAYSVPHGVGTIDSSRIEFSIPYSSSTFRDIFSFNETTGSWTLTIDSQVDSLTWKNFAFYDIRKR